MVCSTLAPDMRWNRANTSLAMKPSGCPTCRPAPDGYGNMSWTKSLSGASGPLPSKALMSPASGPTGLGASKAWR